LCRQADVIIAAAVALTIANAAARSGSRKRFIAETLP
jgi:hypothetical protein